jgi:hypothetical protein
VLEEFIGTSRNYFKVITHWQSNFNILEILPHLIALFILSFRTTMKVSSVVSFSAIFASALAFPTYGNVNARQTWQPRNWTAPGPNDG